MRAGPRQWVARFRYDGLGEAYFGTVVAENERLAEDAAREAWGRVFPIPPPSTFIMVPGFLVLELDDAEEGS